jgi:LPXTG-motif cell wall-anchored protein
MRKGAGYLAILFSIALLFLATAGANRALADPPGNNGTVKIHEGATENEPLRANEPHVHCSFHIHGFNFDAGMSGTWRIEGWAPTGGGIYNGTWGPADGNGDWRSPRTGAMTILPGHYKLSVWQTATNDPPGGAKQKVFWVECGQSSGGAPGNSGGNGNGNSGGNGNGNSGGNGNNGNGNSGGGNGNGNSGGNGNGNGNSGGNSGGTGNSGASVTTGGTTSTSGTTTPTTAATVSGSATAGVVAGVQSGPQAPQGLAGVENLPSTSTDTGQIPLVVLGVFILATGVVLLRRPVVSPNR